MVEMEEKLNKIYDSLIPNLLASGAINENHDIVKPQVFLYIIEKIESDINRLFMLVEENGSITDKYGAELIYARLRVLSDMKEKMSVEPYKVKFEHKAAEQKPASKFRIGLFNIFKKSKSAQKPSAEKSR